MSRIFIAGTFVPFFLCAIPSSVFSPPGCRPWSVRIRDIQHYRRVSRRLSEAAQPGGHGHGDHLHCSGIVTKTCLLPPGWCAQYNAITIVGGDNRIMSRSLNICEHEVIGLNIFSFSVSAVWGVLTIYRTFTDNSWQNLLHFHPLQVILQLLFIQDIARRRIASADQVSNFNEHVKPFLRYWYLFRIAQSQDGKL